MKDHIRKTAELGELVVTAFDEAARFSTDPREVSRLATQAIAHMLRVLPSLHWGAPTRPRRVSHEQPTAL